MKEIIEKLKKKGLKFILAYMACSGIYAFFEYVYMPWLLYKFGGWMFLSLYPSILFANFGGVYVYNWIGEDVLFMEFGSSWISEEGGKLEWLKGYLRNSRKKIFIALSIWPSPIASYLFFRENKKDTALSIFKCIAIGSVWCTVAWGGLLGLAWLIIVRIIQFVK